MLENPLTRIDLSRQALEHNVGVFRRLAPDSLFMAVIKANGYGHGLKEMVALLAGKVDYFGVNTASEALQIREVDLETPVLVMGRNGDEDYLELAERKRGVEIVISTLDHLKLLKEKFPQLPFHLKVDTGMGRLGASNSELKSIAEFLAKNRGLALRGIMSHFANVEDVTDQNYAARQLESFQQALQVTEQAKRDRKTLTHIAASASALILPRSRMDLIRIGISLYGLWPSEKTRISLNSAGDDMVELKPVLSWQTTVVHLNRVTAGSYIGYGCSYRTICETVVAVLPVGYYEGYSRLLSNNSFVIIRGRRAPLVGRVCMNMMMVDVTNIPEVAIGDAAILIGQSGDETISADELAERARTINYETVTMINETLPRRVVD